MKLPKHFWNVVFLIVGLSLAFIGTWQVDIISYTIIWRFARDWTFYFPFISMPWTAAFAWMLFKTWVGFLIALFALWFWED